MFEENPLLAIGLLLITVVILIYVTRAIFGIPQIIRSLRANAYLLALIAAKQGCDQMKIGKALNHVQGYVMANELPPISDTSEEA